MSDATSRESAARVACGACSGRGWVRLGSSRSDDPYPECEACNGHGWLRRAGHSVADRRIYAGEVKPGDFIMWAGRVAEVVDVRVPLAASAPRHGERHLVLDVDGDDRLRRCHYYDTEVVTLRSRLIETSAISGGSGADA